jgi:hypothetical protein
MDLGDTQEQREHRDGIDRMVRIYTDTSYKTERPLAPYIGAPPQLKVNTHAATLAVKSINKLLEIALSYLAGIIEGVDVTVSHVKKLFVHVSITHYNLQRIMNSVQGYTQVIINSA